MNTVYRYRPNSGLSFKELKYNEIVFSKLSELNDPMDAKIDFVFPACKACWENLFDRVWHEGEEPPERIDELIAFLSSKCWDRSSLFWHLENSSYFKELGVTRQLGTRIIGQIKPWTSPNLFVSSFSRNYDHPVMWAHYANSHQGYCLEFEVIDDRVHHSKLDEILPIFRNNYNAIKFQSIEYVEKYMRLNGFMANPYLNDTHDNSLFSSCLLDSVRKKYDHWDYEEEERMMVLDSVPMFGDSQYFPESRIYQYDFLQLRGVLFGLKVNPADKERLMRIVIRKRFMLMEQYKIKGRYGLIPPLAFYEIREEAPNYRLKRRIHMVLDDENEIHYDISYEKVIDRHKEKLASGKFFAIDNQYDPLEEIGLRLPKGEAF